MLLLALLTAVSTDHKRCDPPNTVLSEALRKAQMRKHSAGQSGRRALRPRTVAQFVPNLAEKAPALVNAAATYSKPRLATFWYYAKVEYYAKGLVPPTPAEIPTAMQSLKKIINSAKTGSFKQLTVKEALLNGLVATEVWMWFYVGEIIGKRGIIGYDV
ncbi:ATP synthase subunit g, mitochondrial-like [Dama dama]